MDRVGAFYETIYSVLKKFHLVSGELEDKRLEASNVKLVVFLVFLMMMLDNMLLTVVVPIIPPILYKFEHGNLDYYTHHQQHSLNHSKNVETVYFKKNPSKNIRSKTYVRWAKRGTQEQDSENYEEYYIDYPVVLNETQAINLTTIISAETTTKATASILEEAPLPEDIINENKRVGMLFASKAIVQLFVNPLLGPIISKVGYGIPLCFGFVVLFLSSIMFAFGKSYGALLMARSIHGISSACLNISGLALIAERFPNDKDRSVYMGRAMSGMAFGVFVGYPFGSLLYQFIGDSAPFWIISLLVVIIGSFTLYVIKPVAVSHANMRPVAGEMVKLIKDKYILIATGSILFSTTSIAVLEPSLPIWLMNKIHPAQWKLGTVFLPDSFGYLIGTNLFGKFALNYGRWKCAIVSMVMIAICLILIPFANHPAHLVLPHFGIGLGIGIVDSSLIPYLGYVVDVRYSGMYGAVYSISQVAVCLAYGLGPSIGGSVVKSIGFRWLVWGTAILNLAYAPALWYLKNPPESFDSGLLMNEIKRGDPFGKGRVKETYGMLNEEEEILPVASDLEDEWSNLSGEENYYHNPQSEAEINSTQFNYYAK